MLVLDLRDWFAASVLLVLSGCASAPVQELQAYATAYEEVRTGSHLLLDEISPFVKIVPRADGTNSEGPGNAGCNPAAEDIPPCFDPNQALLEVGIRVNEDPSIIARRAALDVTMEYNKLLLALAEGKSAESLTQRFGEFQSIVSTAASLAVAPTAGASALIPVAFQLLGELATRIETARANNTIRESIIASKDDIDELLRLLIEDTSDIYDIYHKGHSLELISLNRVKNKARLANQPELQANLESQVQAHKQRMRDFYNSLGAYTRALAAARSSLDNLARAAAAKGTTSIEDISAVVRDAAAFKTKADNFLNLIRAVRAPPPPGGAVASPS